MPLEFCSSDDAAVDRCKAPGCEFEAGHDAEHPHGQRVIDGQPCKFCGEPEPCEKCWQPITVAMFKGLCADAGKDTKWT